MVDSFFVRKSSKAFYAFIWQVRQPSAGTTPGMIVLSLGYGLFVVRSELEIMANND
jgi:hypothetical protein